MSVLGFFILLAISISIHTLSKKFIPVAVPKGRIKVWFAGWLGALAASLLEGLIGPWELKIAGFYLIAAAIGALVSILGWGISPFVGILFGMKKKKLYRSSGNPPGEKYIK